MNNVQYLGKVNRVNTTISEIEDYPPLMYYRTNVVNTGTHWPSKHDLS